MCSRHLPARRAVDGFQQEGQCLSHPASGTQQVFREQEAPTTSPDATPTKGSRVRICSSWAASGQEIGSGSSSPRACSDGQSRARRTRSGGNPLLLVSYNPGREIRRGRWGRRSGSLLLNVELLPTDFSNIRSRLPSLLRKRHAFGCVLKNIPYANGMSPSAKGGRAVFKGKTITEPRYSQRGTQEPKRG